MGLPLIDVGLLEWLSQFEGHWLFEPFTSLGMEVFVWWIVAFVAVMIPMWIAEHGFGIDPEVDVFPDGFGPKEKIATAVVIAPILEEGLFRVGPALLDVSFAWMLIATGVWVLLHGKRFPVVAVFAPIYLKLALGGLLLEAVLVHALHNGFTTAMHLLGEHYNIGDD